MFGLKKAKESATIEPETIQSSVEIKTDAPNPTTSTNEVEIVDEARLQQTVEEKKEQPKEKPLTYREIKALKNSKYYDVMHKYDTAFVLKNRKTGQIVELRAVSSVHACNMIGWRINNVYVVAEKKIDMGKEQPATEQPATEQPQNNIEIGQLETKPETVVENNVEIKEETK